MTGVTAVLPHGGNLFQEKVPGAVFVGNAFGKLAGSTQVKELGTIESPIVLTNTLVGRNGSRGDGPVDARSSPATSRTFRQRPRRRNKRWQVERHPRPARDARARLAAMTRAGEARSRRRRGAGTGTVAFGWKGGIGTSSRRRRAQGDTWTVGVLVQTNYGGRLVIDGVPIWKALLPEDRRRNEPGRTTRRPTAHA